MIPEAAVEAAARVIADRDGHPTIWDYDADTARAALEAAAPHMLADAWDVGYMAGREDESSTHVPFMNHTHTPNPYRSQHDVH